MSLDIGDAIRDGFEKTTQKSAAILVGIFLAASIFSQAMGDTLIKNFIQAGEFSTEMQEALSQIPMSEMAPLAVEIPSSAAIAGTIIASLISLVATVGMIRVFLKGQGAELKTSYFTDNIPWIAANMIIGGILFTILVLIGSLAFLIPGIFIFVSLFFWSIYVIDKEVNFIEAMKSAWNDVKGDRFSLFGLLVIVTILTSVFISVTGGIIALIGDLVASRALGSVLGLVPTSIGTVFTWAVFTEAYKQVSE